jgi:hypothetical protein
MLPLWLSSRRRIHDFDGNSVISVIVATISRVQLSVLDGVASRVAHRDSTARALLLLLLLPQHLSRTSSIGIIVIVDEPRNFVLKQRMLLLMLQP